MSERTKQAKAVTFHRVIRGQVRSVEFAWDDSNRGGWRATDGSVWVAMPVGTPRETGVAPGWCASAVEALEAAITEALDTVSDHRRRQADAQDYVDKLKRMQRALKNGGACSCEAKGKRGSK